MVVEHSFVTTLPFTQVYELVASLMHRFGFTLTTECAHCGYDLRGTMTIEGARCPECGSVQAIHTRGEATSSVLIARRGKKTASAARKTEDLPQNIRVEFDRGRINIAASIAEKGKVMPVHRNMMLTVVEALEATLVKGDDGTSHTEAWQRLKLDGEDHDRKQRQKRATGCSIAVILVIALFIIAIVIASTS